MGANRSTLLQQPLEDAPADGAPPAAASASVTLYRWQPAASSTGPAGRWDKEGGVDVTFEKRKAQKHHLLAGSVLDALVSHAANLTALANERRAILTVGTAVWCLRFATATGFEMFLSEWDDALFENTFNKEATPANRKKIFGEDFEDWAAGEDPEGAEEILAREPADDVPMQAPASETRVGHRSPPAGDDGRAAGLHIGANANSYLLRGANVEVYKNVANGVADAAMSLSALALDGTPIRASRALLSQRETNMLLLTPDRPDRVFQMDIEREKVVSEWSCAKDGVEIPMLDIHGDSKSSQLEATQTFLGLDANRLCRWDMRVKDGLVSNLTSPSPVLGYAGGHDFSRGTNFTCLATTGDGCVAVGSDDGKIRLYTDSGLRQAKTSFPGLGLPVTSIDVTYDGSWVLATTDAYLVLLCTTAKDPATGEFASGFRKRLARSLLAPRLLKLLPDDGARVGGAPFRKGKFTWVTEAGRSERSIVASAGNFTVLWNFRRARQGRSGRASLGGGDGLASCSEYHLIPKDEAVVDHGFMHERYLGDAGGAEALLVVATESDVYSCA